MKHYFSKELMKCLKYNISKWWLSNAILLALTTLL